MQRTVTAHLEFSLGGQSDLLFQIAVAAGTPILSESFTFSNNGRMYLPREIVDRHGTRILRFTGDPGNYDVFYSALVAGSRPVEPVGEIDLVSYLRPSRYAESDALYVQARSMFAGLTGLALVNAVATWTHDTLEYVPGSSRGTDSARTTLNAGRGVCRDFAHVVVTMLRACDVPARVAAVYAPGLAPMDFHAVAEAWVDGRWRVVDATRLAPRQSLVRISTGRDASDIAFLTNHIASVALSSVEVNAVSDTHIVDDHLSAAVLA
ncbi:transglutaminase-like domain-containing protein [Paramicrobacterium agarici]|uniref:Transglutaminase superfamily protein n=1 Tax=Paramicrobacterium agarici TaxID=630514 RepID=A0A2A9DWF9_9MICO|nr:transglutaminase family protein [Microbacterium agarici]PFG30914.1 transglutaminase superfamily protein [Microbacterium agarici]TQO23980.1 transglutaminase superfamily protein [Microbacterium agarici]